MKKLLPFLLLSVVLCSCGKDEPDISKGTNGNDTATNGNNTEEKQPTANFSYSPTNPRGLDVIYFTNNSKDADFYEWDFGNNKTSKEKNPTCFYDSPGTWTVRLTAYSKNKTKKDVVTKTINVKKEYSKFKIYKITVNQISFVLSNGSGWDSGSGPDIYFKIYNGSNLLHETGYVSDIKTSDIPFSISSNFTSNYSTFYWTIYMYDWDGVGDDKMTEFTFSSLNIPNRNTSVVLKNGSFQITLYLEWIE